MEINTDKKFVAVLNRNLPQGVIMNALAHMAACLVSRYPNIEEMGFVDYSDKGGGKHPVSALTFIILEGNSNKIRGLRKEAISRGIQEMERTKNTPETELEYYGICLFGDKPALNELARKFSLWK